MTNQRIAGFFISDVGRAKGKSEAFTFPSRGATIGLTLRALGAGPIFLYDRIKVNL